MHLLSPGLLFFVVCLCAQLSKSALTEHNVDYFVYNELSDKFTRIGLSLVQQRGILAYAQRNGATISNDNLVTGNSAAWESFDQQNTFDVTSDDDVTASVKFPYTLLGTKKGIHILKYSPSAGDFAAEFTLMPNEIPFNLELDSYAMSESFFAVSGKTNSSKRCLLYYTRQSSSDWDVTYSKCVDGDVFATSLAASESILAVGFKGEKVELVDARANSILWSSNYVISAPANLETGNEGLGGFAAVLYFEGLFLAVGAPSVKNDVHAGSHHGRAYIYNVSSANDIIGPFELHVPSELITISTDSEEGSSIGVQFGASFFVSEILTTTSIPGIFVGVGAPGANGVVLYYLEDQYFSSPSPTSMFEIKSTQFLQGFRLKLDHDTGDAVSWDIYGERMFVGAPKADNYDQYAGRMTRYGADGRLYVVTICQPNRYRYSANRYSYIKTCVDCSSGTYSLGGYVSQCTSCNAEFPKPLHSSWDGASRGCSYTCHDNYFGSACETCEAYMLTYGNPPLHSKWKSINGVCTFKCDDDYDINPSLDGCTAAAAPNTATVTDVTWSSVMLSWNITSGLHPTTHFEKCHQYSILVWNGKVNSTVGPKEPVCFDSKISMHVTALNASSTYRFRVRRGVFGIFSDYTREVQTLPAVSSAAPRDIQIMNTTGGVLSLKWSKPMDNGGSTLLHYMVEVCQNFSFCRQINSTEPNIILSPMRAYKSYNFRIAAVTAHSVGNFSRWQFLTMGRPYPPGGISTPTLYNANCSLVFLSMVALKENEDGGERPSSYVFRMLDQRTGMQITQEIKVENGISNVFELNFFESGGTYNIYARAKNSGGLGPENSIPLIMTMPEEVCLPYPPRNIRISKVGSDSAEVCFGRPLKDGGATISNFSVYVYNLKKNALVVEKSIFVNETGLSKLDLSVSRICSNVTNLFASASYYVKCRASNSAGVSVLSEPSMNFSTDVAIPPSWKKGQKVSQDKIFGGKLNLFWEEPISHGGSAMKYYAIGYLRKADTVNACDNQVDDVLVFIGNTTTTHFTLYRLLASSSFCVYIRGYNAVGSSSLVGEAYTGQVDPASSPTDVTLASISPSLLTLTWSVPTYLGGSQVRRYRITLWHFNLTRTYFTEESTATIVNLLGGQEYNLSIAAITGAPNGNDLVGQSLAVSFKSLPPKEPNPATELSINSKRVGAGHVELNWKSPVETGGRPIIKENIAVFRILVDDDGNKGSLIKHDSRLLTNFNLESVVVNGLLANTTYMFIVRLNNEVGLSNFSLGSIPVKLKSQTQPGEAAVLSLNSSTETSLTLTCKAGMDLGGASPDSVYFMAKISSTAVDVQYLFGKIKENGWGRFVVGNLSPNTSYNVSVGIVVHGHPFRKSLKINSNAPLYVGNSDKRITVSTGGMAAQTEQPTPSLNMSVGTIPGFQITFVNFNSIGFVWRAPIFDDETLNYTVKCTDDQGSELSSPTTSALGVVVSGLSAATFYGCYISSFDINGNEIMKTRIANPIYTRDEFPPEQPTQVRIVGDTKSSSLSVTFEPPAWVNFNPNLAYKVDLYAIELDPFTNAYETSFMSSTTIEANHNLGESEAVSIEIYGVLANKVYRVKVAAKNRVGSYGIFSEFSNAYTNGNHTIPNPPSQLTAGGILTSSSLMITWQSPLITGGFSTAELSYNVSCCPSSFAFSNASSNLDWDVAALENCGWSRNIKNVSSTVVKNLLGDTTYVCRSRSSNPFGLSQYSLFEDFNVVTTLSPHVPSRQLRKPILQLATASSIAFSWAATDFDSGGSPILRYTAKCTNGSFVVTRDVDSAHIEAEINQLTALTTYCCTVRAINHIGNGPYGSSCLMAQTTPATKPSSINYLRTQVDSSPGNKYANISLRWDVPDETGGLPLIYEIFYSQRVGFDSCENYRSGLICDSSQVTGMECQTLPQGDPPIAVKIGETLDTSISNLWLPPGGLYYLKVHAKNLEGQSPHNVSCTIITAPAAPPKPTGFRAVVSSIFSDMINVTWEAVEVFGCRRTLRYDLDVYNIDFGQKVLSYTTTASSYFTPSVLNCSTGYKWCIRSKNAMGASPWNCELVVETNSTVPQRVCSMSVVEVNAVSIQIQWEPPCNLCGGTDIKYDVKIKKENGGAVPSTIPGGVSPFDLVSTSYRFTGLDMSTKYIVSVRAKSEFGFGPWRDINYVETDPRKNCPIAVTNAICSTTGAHSVSAVPCACHGLCHPWDGTCACYGGWKGHDCSVPDGIEISIQLSGNVEDWTDDVKSDVSTILASSIGIDQSRIPPALMSVEAGSVILKLLILNANIAKEAIGNEITATAAGSKFESLVLDGKITSLPIETIAIGGSNSKKIIAPSQPLCDFVDEDSCAQCLSKPGCGWCDSQKFCSPGSESGMALFQNRACNSQSKWRFGKNSQNTCDPTSTEVCSRHLTCRSCLAEQSFSCGWCAETGKCIPHKKSTLVCPNWGYTIGNCAADCSRNDFKVGLEGYVWLGDDRPGSELYYKGNKQCKWHIAPGQDPSDESAYEVGRIDIVLERADIARRDRLIVYEGNTRSSDAILIDINGNSGSTSGDFPVTVSTSSNMVIFEFSSDHSAATVGTGFLARYKSHKKTFWDSHILVALMLLSICSCMCCICFRCTARRNGNAEVENDFGMNLEATDHGARLSSINKFPEFIFSDEHKIKMEKLEQEISCCVCLGEYENGEAVRLLPCGHAFHSPCIDAWLQINRICPLCKVDVIDLAAQNRKKERRDRRATFFKKVLRRNLTKGSVVSPRDSTKSKNFSERQKELLQVNSDSIQSRQKIKRRKKKKKKKRNRDRHGFEVHPVSDVVSGPNQNENFWGLSTTGVSESDEIEDDSHGYRIVRNRLSTGATHDVQRRWQNFSGRDNGWSVGGHSNEDDDLAYAIELSALEVTNSEESHRRRRSRDARPVNRRRPSRIIAPVLHAPRNTTGDESSESTRRRRGSVLV